MHWIVSLLMVIQVICAGAIIILVLLQHGKGADMGAAFGSGSSGSLFGATGSANFLSRTTAVLATLFFVTSIGLTWIASHNQVESSGVMKGVAEPASPGATPKVDAIPADGKAPAGAVPAAPAPKGNEVPK